MELDTTAICNMSIPFSSPSKTSCFYMFLDHFFYSNNSYLFCFVALVSIVRHFCLFCGHLCTILEFVNCSETISNLSLSN